MQASFYTCQLTPGMIVCPSIFGISAIAKVLSCDCNSPSSNYFVCLQDAAGNEYEIFVSPDHEWVAMPDDAFQLLATKH